MIEFKALNLKLIGKGMALHELFPSLSCSFWDTLSISDIAKPKVTVSLGEFSTVLFILSCMLCCVSLSFLHY